MPKINLTTLSKVRALSASRALSTWAWLSPLVTMSIVACSNATFEGDTADPQLKRKAASPEIATSTSTPGATTAPSSGLSDGGDPTASSGDQGRRTSSLDAMSGQSSTNDNPRDKIDRWIPPLLPPKEPPATVPDGPHMESLPPDVAPPAQSEPPPSMDMPPPVPVEPPAPVPMPVPAPMPTPVLEPVPAPMPAPAPVPAPMPAPAPMPVPAPAPAPAPVPPIMPPEVVLRPCSEHYRVPATANPYFAGVADGASLLYRITQYDPPTPIDFSPMNAPVLVATIGDCITPGKAIYFSVAGNITFSRVDPPTDANGSINQIVRHQRGAQFGKSDIAAPINSLIGVFIGEGDPASQPAPAGLDFSTQAARDYRTLSPALGQVFFIGTGKTSAGDLRKVIVPSGAARLYFAVMDIYQWNNNSGELSGAVMVE